MTVGYKRRYLNANLIMGLFWLFWFFLGFLTKDELHWMDFGWIVISLIYICLYLYCRQKKYLSIENGMIKENGLFGKKMQLTEIKWIRKFAGDYILKSDNRELKINTQIIDPASLANLNAELEKLNVRWN